MKAIITVGLGFGDEGKGSVVDFLTRELSASLVVRYCGGAQAGHNVQLPDGRRHTFSQFGAGTLAGARTYLGPQMIICPATLVPEADHLRDLGIADPWSQLTAHPDCLVSTTYHAVMNRLRESARGEGRHGSCGLGIGETRHYWLRYGQDAVTAGDLTDPDTLQAKLSLIRQRFLIEMQDLSPLDREHSVTMHALLPHEEADTLQRVSQQLEISRRMPPADCAIFEGSQGVLLDEWHGFHPYTTWSTVTPQHALELLAPDPDAEISILGITRAYSTRHGAGPFPAFCPQMSAGMIDVGNPRNDWQGSIRFGPLDMMLADYGARAAQVDGIFVNCLDQLPRCSRLITSYQDWDRIATPRSLEQQQWLTQRLSAAVPRMMATTEQGILDALDSIAPIVGISRGACFESKLALSPENAVRSSCSAAPQLRTLVRG